MVGDDSNKSACGKLPPAFPFPLHRTAYLLALMRSDEEHGTGYVSKFTHIISAAFSELKKGQKARPFDRACFVAEFSQRGNAVVQIAQLHALIDFVHLF